MREKFIKADKEVLSLCVCVSFCVSLSHPLSRARVCVQSQSLAIRTASPSAKRTRATSSASSTAKSRTRMARSPRRARAIIYRPSPVRSSLPRVSESVARYSQHGHLPTRRDCRRYFLRLSTTLMRSLLDPVHINQPSSPPAGTARPLIRLIQSELASDSDDTKEERSNWLMRGTKCTVHMSGTQVGAQAIWEPSVPTGSKGDFLRSCE